MNLFFRDFHEFAKRDGVAVAERTQCARLRWWIVAILATLVIPISCLAESRAGYTGTAASIDFRIIIPAIIRVTTVSQPDRIVIGDRDITQGYIDLDAGSSVRLTNNERSGYLLTANYDAQLLSKVEVQISGQNLTALSGTGSLHVASGLVIDKLVPISYRLHLAPGVRAGDYRWPVALAFSLAFV